MFSSVPYNTVGLWKHFWISRSPVLWFRSTVYGSKNEQIITGSFESRITFGYTSISSSWGLNGNWWSPFVITLSFLNRGPAVFPPATSGTAFFGILIIDGTSLFRYDELYYTLLLLLSSYIMLSPSRYSPLIIFYDSSVALY